MTSPNLGIDFSQELLLVLLLISNQVVIYVTKHSCSPLKIQFIPKRCGLCNNLKEELALAIFIWKKEAILFNL